MRLEALHHPDATSAKSTSRLVRATSRGHEDQVASARVAAKPGELGDSGFDAPVQPSFHTCPLEEPAVGAPPACAILANEDTAKDLGLPILARFVHLTSVGVDPAIMGIGAVPAIRRLLAKTRLSVADIDLFEINEAFASHGSCR